MSSTLAHSCAGNQTRSHLAGCEMSHKSSGPPSRLHGLAQEGNADRLVLERHTEEEKRADLIGQVLGWRKVGWIFAQSTRERDFIMSVEEVCQMAGVQLEMGPQAVTGVVSMSPEGDVHFEAFQVMLLPRARSTTLSLWNPQLWGWSPVLRGGFSSVIIHCWHGCMQEWP